MGDQGEPNAVVTHHPSRKTFSWRDYGSADMTTSSTSRFVRGSHEGGVEAIIGLQ